MPKSPEQQAAEDHEVVQAAFERARAKLAAARSPAEQQRKAAWAFLTNRNAWKGLLYSLVVAVGLIFFPWPDQTDRPWLVVHIAAMVWLIVGGGWYLYRAFGGHGAARTVRHFYCNAFSRHRDSKCIGLAETVVASDLDLSLRRPPAFNAEGAVTAPLAEAEDLDNYWNHLLRPENGVKVKGEVKSIKLKELDDDLVLATVRLRMSREPIWVGNSFYTLIPVTVLAVLMVTSAYDVEDWTLFFVPALLALFAVPPLLRLVLVKLRAYRPKEYTVRKLVVRTGRSWRMFCGDWEGHEEADLSWLDGVPPARAPSTGSAV